MFLKSATLALLLYLQRAPVLVDAIQENTTSVDKIDPFGSARFKVFFDAIDKVHDILEDSDLAQHVPSCVVVGMQSVGKSAVLSRISGIPFPQDSEVCTRVPIELRLRRDTIPKNELEIKSGNSDGKKVDASDRAAVENSLVTAQKQVLNGKQFEDKLSVKVEKVGRDVPDVTLVDLPGVFFAKDDQSENVEELVKNMIKNRVHNEMALILHVVPLNQDTDTISTWRIVRDADSEQTRTISVLTKADLALKDGKDVLKKRIQKIVSDGKESECFIVHGAVKTLEDEESQLTAVSKYIKELGLENTVKVGLNQLNEYIESRMLDHIRKKTPDMMELLESELRRCNSELDSIGRQALIPNTAAIRDLQNINGRLSKTYEEFQPTYRRLTENMAKNIMDIYMQPLGIVDKTEALSTLGEHCTLSKNVYICESNLNDNNILALGVKKIVLALEVKKIGEESRTMLNVPFVGLEYQLKKWIIPFTKPLETVMKEYISHSFDGFYSKILQPSFQKGSSEPTKIVIKHLERLIGSTIVAEAKNGAYDYAYTIVDSVRENTFTTNNHYLLSETRLCEEDIDSDRLSDTLKSWILPHFSTLCKLHVFFEWRKQVLTDTIQLHFSKVLKDLLNSVQQELGIQMMSEHNLALIKEPSHIVEKRKFYLEREEKIRSALDEIRLL